MKNNNNSGIEITKLLNKIYASQHQNILKLNKKKITMENISFLESIDNNNNNIEIVKLLIEYAKSPSTNYFRIEWNKIKIF